MPQRYYGTPINNNTTHVVPKSLEFVWFDVGISTVPVPYRISDTYFLPSKISGTGTVSNGIRISVPVPGNRVFPVFIREFPDLVPVPYRINGPDFFSPYFVVPIPYCISEISTVWYGTGSVPGFGSKWSSLFDGYFDSASSNRNQQYDTNFNLVEHIYHVIYISKTSFHYPCGMIN